MRGMSRYGVLAAILVALAGAGAASAQIQPPDPPPISIWSIQPPDPTTRDVVFVRNVFTGCDDHSFSQYSPIRIDHQARTVTVEMWGSDVCDNYVVEREANAIVGRLSPGNWRLTWLGCNGAEPDPADACTPALLPPIDFVVANAGLAHATIPASSTASRFALAAILAAIGLWLARPRR